MSKMGKRVHRKIENSVDRLRARAVKAAPVARTFWAVPEMDTCFDILVLTYNACYQPTAFLRPSGAPDRLAI